MELFLNWIKLEADRNRIQHDFDKSHNWDGQGMSNIETTGERSWYKMQQCLALACESGCQH